MKKAAIILIGLLAVVAVFQSCTTSPEKGILSRYFNAMTLNDNDTMSSMALDPLQLDLDSWRMVSVSPDKVTPVTLPDLNAKEVQFKKDLENHVGPTMDAKDALDVAKEDLDLARSAGAKAAAKAKVDSLQAKYDAEYAKHKELQQAYNDAKAAAAAEESLTLFSLGEKEDPAVRSMTGTVHNKQVEVTLKLKSGGAKKFRIYMVKYDAKDEAQNIRHNGAWKIRKFEKLD